MAWGSTSSGALGRLDQLVGAAVRAGAGLLPGRPQALRTAALAAQAVLGFGPAVAAGGGQDEVQRLAALVGGGTLRRVHFVPAVLAHQVGLVDVEGQARPALRAQKDLHRLGRLGLGRAARRHPGPFRERLGQLAGKERQPASGGGVTGLDGDSLLQILALFGGVVGGGRQPYVWAGVGRVEQDGLVKQGLGQASLVRFGGHDAIVQEAVELNRAGRCVHARGSLPRRQLLSKRRVREITVSSIDPHPRPWSLAIFPLNYKLNMYARKWVRAVRLAPIFCGEFALEQYRICLFLKEAKLQRQGEGGKRRADNYFQPFSLTGRKGWIILTPA